MSIQNKPLLISQVDECFNHQLQGLTQRLTFMIRAGMCDYWQNGKGPCNMCPLPIYQKEFLGGKKPDWKDLGPAFNAELNKVWKNANPQVVRIFHAGNYIHENEVSIESQIGMIEALSKRDSVKILIIESKPEYITKEILSRLVNAIDGKFKLQINMGVEIADEEIRQKHLNKGFTNLEYIRAIKLLNEFNIYSFTYLIIQPIGISAEQAKNSIMESVKWITSIEPNTEVNLLALYIENGTRLYKLWEKGLLKPPTLITVAKSIITAYETHPKGYVSFGGIVENEEVSPVDFAKGCDGCQKLLTKALKDFKINLNLTELKIAVASIFNCSC